LRGAGIPLFKGKLTTGLGREKKVRKKETVCGRDKGKDLRLEGK